MYGTRFEFGLWVWRKFYVRDGFGIVTGKSSLFKKNDFTAWWGCGSDTRIRWERRWCSIFHPY